MRRISHVAAVLAAALLLVACPKPGPSSETRIVSFVATPSTVLRGASVTLTWQVTGAGSREGVDPCSLTRRAEGEAEGLPFAVSCTGSLSEVPPAGPAATYIRYQLNVVKQPFDPVDPYLTSVVTVTLEERIVPPRVLSVAIDQADLGLWVGEDAALTVTVSVEGGASTDVTWASDNAAVADVDAFTGVVTGVGEGTALVSAISVADSTKADSITVTVSYDRFGDGVVLDDQTGPRQRYSRGFVAVDGERALVSKISAIDGTWLPGQVALHRFVSPGVWVSSASLAPPPGSTYRLHGVAVALRGSTAVVLGTRLVSAEPDVYESVLHVFEEDATGNWTRRAELLAGEGVGTSFSTFPNVAIALAADTLAVGLPSLDGAVASSVRVYERDEGGPVAWGLAAVIPSPATLGDPATGFFGSDVDLSEDGQRLAVATSYQSDNACLGDAVFVYERSPADPAEWRLIETLGADVLPCGCSCYVQIDGDILAVTSIPSNTGRVTVFERGSGGAGPDAWGVVRTETITVPTYDDTMVFWARSALRLRGDTLLFGLSGARCESAVLDPSEIVCTPGAVHVLRRNAGGLDAWGVDQVLQPEPAYPDQGFGAALDISVDGRLVAVATNPAPTSDASRGGEVFLFAR